jgi:hypothetical protein
LAALWTILPLGEITNSVLKYRSGITSGQRALHCTTMYVSYCLARAASCSLSSPGTSMNSSRAAVTCGTSKISSVNPVSAPSASAISLIGMLMLMTPIAAWMASSIVARFRRMCFRSATP